MSVNDNILSSAEREKLLEETERIKALQATIEDSDSEEDELENENEGLPPGDPTRDQSALSAGEIYRNVSSTHDPNLPGPSDAQQEGYEQQFQFQPIEMGHVSSEAQSFEFRGVLPVDEETCLALNRAYQEVIVQNQKRIELVIAQNRERQKELEHDLEMKVNKSSGETLRRKPITIYFKPYFKDINSMPPPENRDAQVKKELGEANPVIRMERPWYATEKKKLKNAVKEDMLKIMMQPLLSKKEILCDKMNKMIAGTPERSEVLEKIQDIDAQLVTMSQLPEDDLYGNLDDAHKVDWMKIEVVDMNGIHSASNCELLWRNYLHPSINTGRWSNKEDADLEKLVEMTKGKNCWQKVAQTLGTNRSAYMCLQRYQQKFNPEINVRDWSADEDKLLLEVTMMCRVGTNINWGQVSYYLEGHSQNDCRRRYYQINPENKRGRFTKEEDDKILEAVQKFGQQWVLVAQEVPGRNCDQCRERYNDALAKDVVRGGWSYEEDRKIYLFHREHGPKWSLMSKTMPGRTDAQLLRRYRVLKKWEKINAHIRKEDPINAKLINFTSKAIQPSTSHTEDVGKTDLRNQLSVIDDTDEQATAPTDYVQAKLKEMEDSRLRQEKLENAARSIDIQNGLIVPRNPLFISERQYYNTVRHKKKINSIIQKKIKELRNVQKPSRKKISVDSIVCQLPPTIKKKLNAVNSVVKKRDVKDITKAIKGVKKPRGKRIRDEEEQEMDEEIFSLVRTCFFKPKKGRQKKLKIVEDENEGKPQVAALFLKAYGVNTQTFQQQAMTLKQQYDLEGTSGVISMSEALSGKSNLLQKSSNSADCIPQQIGDGPVKDILLTTESVHSGQSSQEQQNSYMHIDEPNLNSGESSVQPSLLEKSGESSMDVCDSISLHSNNPRCPQDILDLLDKLESEANNEADDLSDAQNDLDLVEGNLPPLPPCFSSLLAFRHLLLQRSGLVNQDLDSPVADEVQQILPIIRSTADYKKLKSRFMATFLWPSLLTLVDVDDSMPRQTQDLPKRRKKSRIPLVKSKRSRAYKVKRKEVKAKMAEILRNAFAERGTVDADGEQKRGRGRPRKSEMVSKPVTEVVARRKSGREIKPVLTYLDTQHEQRLEQLNRRRKMKEERAEQLEREAELIERREEQSQRHADESESAPPPGFEAFTPVEIDMNEQVLDNNNKGSGDATVSKPLEGNQQGVTKGKQTRRKQSKIQSLLSQPMPASSTTGSYKLMLPQGSGMEALPTLKLKGGMKHKAFVLKVPPSAKPFQLSSDVLNMLVAQSGGRDTPDGSILPSGVQIQIPGTESRGGKNSGQNNSHVEIPSRTQITTSSDTAKSKADPVRPVTTENEVVKPPIELPEVSIVEEQACSGRKKERENRSDTVPQRSAEPGKSQHMKHRAFVLKLPRSCNPLQLSSDILNKMLAESAGAGSCTPVLPSGVQLQIPTIPGQDGESQRDTNDRVDVTASQIQIEELPGTTT